jgi:peptide/nickel transport system substrate-binding protein
MRKLSVLIVLAAVALALNGPIDIQAQMRYKEAPMLAELVKAGKLPPVEQRLPKEPAVVKPFEEIGQYGGTWRRAYLGPADIGAPMFRLPYDPLVRWAPNYSTVLPNLAKSWDVSEGGRVFTFRLVEGVKWSDGTPFTSDDIAFWYEDVLLNKDLTPTFPRWLTVGGEPVKVEKVGDYTVRFRFSSPYGLFLQNMAQPQGMEPVLYPKHYLRQFHPRYVSMDKLNQMAKEAKLESWNQLFLNKGTRQGNADLPTLSAWRTTIPIPATRFTMERNPYYWKVDPAGNQLPYIDRIVHDLLGDREAVVLKAVSGEIDNQQRHLDTKDFTLLMENREKGGYRMPKLTHTAATHVTLYPNFNHKDPVLRGLIHDRRFRFALSLAINRQEINELVYSGLAEPRQASPRRDSPYYYEKLEKAYAQYDPKRANQLLDEMGLTRRDSEGFRLRPDGKTLALTIDMTPGWEDQGTIIRENWEAIGIKTALKVSDRSLWTTRWQAADTDVVVWWGEGGSGIEPVLNFRVYSPVDGGHLGGQLYNLWYRTGGKSGEEPPPDIKRTIELYEKIQTTVDEGERARLMREVLDLNAENIWTIGVTSPAPLPWVVKNNMRNVPESDLATWPYPNPGPIYPEQFFFKR